MNFAVNIATILAILSLTHCFCKAQEPLKATEQRCDSTNDCTDPDKVCYEKKCICGREKPIEDETEGRCYPQVLIGERCTIDGQCLVDAVCMGGTCLCREDAVAVYNPSTRISYCHQTRRLGEKCNSDPQCPINAYCSITGCLCSNGYGSQSVSNDNGVETTECLPKVCSSESDCAEYHHCEDKKCKCLPTHFDINTARCHKYAGKLSGPDQNSSSTIEEENNHRKQGGDIISIFKDLTSMTSDNLWLVLIILIILSLILLILILSLLRKHYLGYCWTAHKKEYEPNTAKQQAPKNGHFDKNSINNKSFRRRNGDALDCDDEEAGNDSSTEDKSNLVAKKNQGDFVTVNLNTNVGGRNESSSSSSPPPVTTASSSEQRRLNNYHHQGPLKSSTSTPV